VPFQGNELALDHGSLQVDTAREMKVLLGCVTVSPLTSDQPQCNVTDVDGKVKAVVSKDDVKIHLHNAVGGSKPASSSDAVVREDEQATRQHRCGGPIKVVEGLDAKGAILNRPWAKGAGMAAIGLTCLIVCHVDDPVSRSKP
jgi:hypothetical protein